MKKEYVLKCVANDNSLLGYFHFVKNGLYGLYGLDCKEQATKFKNFDAALYEKNRAYRNGFSLRLVVEEAKEKPEDVKIPGYTLHGDYYLADKVIPNKTWKEACAMTQIIDLPNGKKVLARTLSKEELETIPREERKISENGHYWYWTSTPYDDTYAWTVDIYGYFNYYNICSSTDDGGARLGFKNPFLEEKKHSEENKEVKIPGYTLHGDYYLADKVITNTTWEDACRIKQTVTLPNGKKVIAHTLSKEELETIPREERKMEYCWYWTNTLNDVSDSGAWFVSSCGDFYIGTFTYSNDHGGVRLGFKNPFLEEKHSEDEINSAINEVMDSFDYERVHKVMSFIDWEWDGKGIPKIYNLRVESRRLLEEAANKVVEGEEYYFVATGGFKAEAWKNDDNTLGLRLSFVLEECEN